MPAAEAETCRSDALRCWEGRNTEIACKMKCDIIRREGSSAVGRKSKGEGTLSQAAAFKLECRHVVANFIATAVLNAAGQALLSYPGAADS